jgi:hypothetical protein
MAKEKAKLEPDTPGTVTYQELHTGEIKTVTIEEFLSEFEEVELPKC